MRAFLDKERTDAGWRFWLLFVIATNLGWVPGILLGMLLSDSLWPDGTGPAHAALTAIPAGLAFALMQAWVLSRHGVSFARWFVSTALGWVSGILLADWLVGGWIPAGEGFGRIALIGAVAGMWMGLPQAWVLSHVFNRILWWWSPLSFAAWGVQFPGAIPGAVIMFLLRTTR